MPILVSEQKEQDLIDSIKYFNPLTKYDVGINGKYGQLVKELLEYNPSNISLIDIEHLVIGQEVLTNSFINPKETVVLPVLNFSEYSELAKIAIDKGATIDDLHQEYIVKNYLEIFETLSNKLKDICDRQEQQQAISSFENLSNKVEDKGLSKDFDVIR